MAPIYACEPKCPIKPISSKPSKGTDILLITLGIANRNIFLFTYAAFRDAKVEINGGI
jgi:hypothetical protein